MSVLCWLAHQSPLNALFGAAVGFTQAYDVGSPIWFTHSGQELHIETNATLVVHNTSYVRWPHGRHVLSASNLQDIAITGA